MVGKTEQNFNVDDEDVRLHAPIVYNAIQEHYVRIDRLINSLSDDLKVRESIESNTNFFGILPSKEIKYDGGFLHNDDFRISVIYHLCFSNIMGCTLSWESYLYLTKTVQRSFMESMDENLSIDTIMLKFFNVNPNVLPNKYLTQTMRADEFNRAVEIIITELNKLSHYDPEYFDNYEDYYHYIEDHAVEIIKKCHEKELYGTQDLDRFTCACIASKMSLPIIDTLYDIPEVESKFEVTVDNIKNLQAQILNKMFSDEE